MFEAERRRLAAMLPGAEIEHFESGPTIDVIALVDDLDAPIPVLVERGGYSFRTDPGDTARRRMLHRPPFRLTLTDDRDEFSARGASGA